MKNWNKDSRAMEIHNLLDVKSRVELREWLIKNHKTEKECWVIVKRGKPTDDTTFWYIDAVEEALCFGWIDSTTKKIADGVTAQKLCPRNPRSNWSELNKARCRRMERMGLMTDAGRAVVTGNQEYIKIGNEATSKIATIVHQKR